MGGEKLFTRKLYYVMTQWKQLRSDQQPVTSRVSSLALQYEVTFLGLCSRAKNNVQSAARPQTSRATDVTAKLRGIIWSDVF